MNYTNSLNQWLKDDEFAFGCSPVCQNISTISWNEFITSGKHQMITENIELTAKNILSQFKWLPPYKISVTIRSAHPKEDIHITRAYIEFEEAE